MPGRSYELLFALFMLDGYIGNRRAFTILNGVKGAMGETLDKRFFEATHEAEDEAEFEHAMHVDRTRFNTETRKSRLQSQLGEAGN